MTVATTARVLALLAAALLAACTAAQPRDTGIVRDSVGENLPEGVAAAWIHEIDGEPVAHTRGQFRLAAGTHELRVYPRLEAPDYLLSVPNAKYPAYDDGALVLEVAPGEVYYVGARIIRTKENNAGYFLSWEPVVYRATDPRIRYGEAR